MVAAWITTAATRGLGLLGASERAAAVGGELQRAERARRRHDARLAHSAAGSGAVASMDAARDRGQRSRRTRDPGSAGRRPPGRARRLSAACSSRPATSASWPRPATATPATPRSSPWRPTSSSAISRWPAAAASTSSGAFSLRDADARILVFSMHDGALLVRRALAAGARGFVTKASAPECLVTAIHALHARPALPRPRPAPLSCCSSDARRGRAPRRR